MNRGRKLRQMRRFIGRYGMIISEHKRPPNETCSIYRKGGYFTLFASEKLELCCYIWHINKYKVYKALIQNIKERQEELKRSQNLHAL